MMAMKKQREKNPLAIEKDDDLRRKFIARLMNHKSTIEQLSDKFEKPKDEIGDYLHYLRAKAHDKTICLAYPHRKQWGITARP